MTPVKNIQQETGLQFHHHLTVWPWESLLLFLGFLFLFKKMLRLASSCFQGSMEHFIRWRVEGDVVDCHYWWLSTAGALSIHHTPFISLHLSMDSFNLGHLFPGPLGTSTLLQKKWISRLFLSLAVTQQAFVMNFQFIEDFHIWYLIYPQTLTVL